MEEFSVLGMRARELADRYLAGLSQAWVSGVIVLALLIAVVLHDAASTSRGTSQRLAIPLVALLAVLGVWRGWSQRWIGDDAFISFRYAANWARGAGVVWNPGERVEGYTNFLWTALMAAAVRLRLDPPQVATVLSLGAYGGLVVTTARLTSRICGAPGRLAFVIAPLLIAMNPFLESFATSGLETMLVTTMVTLAVERAQRGKVGQAGCFVAAALLAHPDQAIACGALTAAVWAQHRSARAVGRFLTPLVLLFLPYFAWRWRYYGDLWPNTYYAKSAAASYFVQGLTYLEVAVVSGGLIGILALSLRGAIRSRTSVPGAFYLLALPGSLLYIAKIGGDFMNGRLILPLLPVGFALATQAVAHVWSSWRGRGWRGRAVMGLSLLAITPAALSVEVVPARAALFGIADESSFYRMTSFAPVVIDHPFFRIGKSLRRVFKDRGFAPRMAVANVGMAGYYSELPMLDEAGLNDRETARTLIIHRGRPGHEKFASPGRVFAWKADFATEPKYPPPYADIGAINIDAVRLFPLHYERSLFRSLDPPVGRPDADLRATLDALIAPENLGRSASPACDLWFVDFFYLSRTGDDALEARAEAYAGFADPTLGDLAAFSLQHVSPAQAGFQPVRRISFEDDLSRGAPGWVSEGSAFVTWPATGRSLADHGQAYGTSGRFIDTFTSTEGEGATGTLSSPPFRVTGDLMTLSIGGGLDPSRISVDLVIGDARVRTASGCNTEVVGRRAWNVAKLKGQLGRIIVTDRSTGAWGHVIVDDIVEWARSSGS